MISQWCSALRRASRAAAASRPATGQRATGQRATAWAAVLACALAITLALAPRSALASDHDDGENTFKSRNLNLTDLFVFREGDQTGNPNDNTNLVFIMNTNPRSLPRQQYFFNTLARYEFNVTRAASRDTTPTGKPDLQLRFTFGSPDANGQQTISLTRANIAGGTVVSEVTVNAGRTTPAPPAIGNPTPTPVINPVTVDGSALTVFAGLREDPFFFDVEQFFKVRASVLRKGSPVQAFRNADQAVDFARGYNVNAIVMRVPIAFLQQGRTTTTFDVWATISLPQGPIPH